MTTSSSVSWLVTELVLSLLAASGGIVVFYGLWLEESGEKEDFADIKDFRESKRKAVRGRKFVLWGVFAEMVLAFLFATKDGWDLRQVNAAVDQTKPENQRIARVSATVTLTIKGTNIWHTPLEQGLRYNHFITLHFGRSELTKSGVWDLVLICTSCERWWAADESMWAMEFSQDPMSPLWNLRTNHSVKSADDWDDVFLQATFLHRDTQIKSGTVTLFLNSTIKTFSIPPQTAKFEDSGPLKDSGSNVAVKITSGI